MQAVQHCCCCASQLALMALALAVAPFAVIGMNKITLLPPILASVKVVVVELAVKVTVPVEFNFPEMVLFR